ncbi:MAG: IreB family regulatory phosphoprotein [Oscillospiraceae bacterium]|nr:IreB family regulatory phosphoprotein [Oscillospiraceae bacterium]
MEDGKFIATMESIVSSIEKTGMEPYAQLYGYLTTGKEEYITRTGNARKLIKTLNWQQLWDYVKKMEESI